MSSRIVGQNRSSSDDYRQRAREQWTANPCGDHVGRPFEVGSREYFDAIERFRYQIDAPWMLDAVRFERYAGKRVLEIGFGIGTDLLSFARAGAAVTGLDLTPRSLEITKKRLALDGLDADLVLGDAESLVFPNNYFDLVYSFGVLHHIPDTQSAINEIYRVLRPGGRVMTMLYHRRSLWYWGGLIFKRGIMRGGLLNMSVDEMLSRFTEYTETGAMPLVKAYTKAEALELFSLFEDCRIRVEHLNRSDLRFAGRLLPDRILRWLTRNFGWNLFINAVKPISQ